MKPIWLFPLCAAAVVLGGCYSTARHVANVRPDLVKPYAGVTAKYRLGRIVLKKSTFSQRVAAGAAAFTPDQRYPAYKYLMKEDSGAGPGGTHYNDTKLVGDSVRKSLLKNYPGVFTEDPSAIPLAVVVDWAFEYKPTPDYASLFSYWFWPTGAEQTTTYLVWLVKDDPRSSDDELWRKYLAAPKKHPGQGYAVRESEVWETGLLPMGLIPVPGESDWPKTTTFMRAGKGSLVGAPLVTMASSNCFKDLVFEPATDGDVLAAAIMRILNRWQRQNDVRAMVKRGGVK